MSCIPRRDGVFAEQDSYWKAQCVSGQDACPQPVSQTVSPYCENLFTVKEEVHAGIRR